MEGVSLAIQRSNRPVQLQSDCLAALSALPNDSLDRSAYGHLLAEIKGLLENRVFVRVKVSRDQNKVAHCLANYDRYEDNTACWLNQFPFFISELVAPYFHRKKKLYRGGQNQSSKKQARKRVLPLSQKACLRFI